MAKRKRPDNSPTLRDGDKDNFRTIQQAAANGDLGVMRVKRLSDGAYRTVLVAKHKRPEDGFIALTPLAELFEDNPYVLYDAPGAPEAGAAEVKA